MASKESRTLNDPLTAPAVFAEVLAGCCAGEREAQRRLYELFHHRVYRLMVRMAGGPDAADLTQQVFLQLFRKVDQFAGRAKFDTWLYRLAVNEALQHLRNRSRRKCQTIVGDIADKETSDEKRCEQQELLEQALMRLDPDLRSIFVLREVEGLAYSEIAAAVDIPAGTVGSRLNRARRELQKHLSDLGWEP